MSDKICFNENTIILIAFIIIFVIILLMYFSLQLFLHTQSFDNTSHTNVPTHNNDNIHIETKTDIPLIDPILYDDYRVLNDRLSEPVKRPPRYILEGLNYNRINPPYPTRGFTDNFSLLGYLVDDNSDIKQDENKIIRLYGREKYPRSTEFEYYIEINNNGDKIKYSLDKQRRELYDGDNIYVDILKRTFNVNLNKNRDLVYNPYY